MWKNDGNTKKRLIFTKVILEMKKWHKKKVEFFITTTIVGSEFNWVVTQMPRVDQKMNTNVFQPS